MFEHQNVIKILSIDGGGIRGLIPALLLSVIEKKTQKKIYELFDFFAGTSTGGILSLLLNKPNPVLAEKLIELYTNDGAERIFKKNFLTPTNYLFKGEKYDRKGIESVLAEKLENYKLSDALKPVLVPSYEMESRNTVFFNNYDDRYKDIYLKDVARATSAAPTIFEPFKIEGQGTFIDGGVAVNNPAMSAYVEILKLLEKNNIDPSGKKIMVVSLGTGTATSSLCYEKIKDWNPLQWVSGPLISTFFDGNSHTVEYQLRKILPQDCYYRFQLQLPDEKGADALDNSDKKFLDRLRDLTQRYICHDQIDGLPIGWYSKIDNLCQILQTNIAVNP